ncbi:MAG: GNAT family N-acetyltransferase [Pyrinomonadaceae bacterium]
MEIKPIVLEGKFVRLEPMRTDHLLDLFEAGRESSLWQWTNNIVKDERDMERYIRDALADLDRGVAVPFVTIERETGKVIGSTRFGNIDAVHRKAEIGWTWINPGWQRTAINTEAKLLMLTHAFETWKCIRVELKTDSNNEKSRKAIRRIGGVQEGLLRNHMITETGRFRDSVYFSIIDTEWESVKANLTSKLKEQ